MGEDGTDRCPIEEDEEFLRALVANTSEGLLTIDAQSEIVFANPAIESILGYRPDELIGSDKMTIIPERLQSAHRRGLAQYLQTGERNIDWTGVELPALHRDGHEVPVSVSLREHEYDGERLFTGIFTDITEQKRRERRLRDQADELEAFAGVLSHDLRNPLAVARGNVELAREADDRAELRKADEALARMERIVDDTLAHARRDGDVEPAEFLSLRGVARAAWEVVVTGDADLVLPSATWELRARSGRVHQLVENLVRNSVEHGSTGDRTVDAERDVTEGRADADGSGDPGGTDVTVRVGVLDDATGFYVEDDGPGFPDEVRARTASDPAPDGGYGLRIVETVADEHGWSPRFTEAPSGGARVEFRGVTLRRR
ncbi:MAG: PAS domain S-box protein [Haloferacaceae archaeon]